MQQEKPLGLIQQAKDFCSDFKMLTKQSFKLFRLEFQLAKYSLFRLLGLGLMLAAMMMSGWFLIVILGIYLLHVWLNHGWLLPISIVTAINLLLMATLVWRMGTYTKNLKFAHTRKQWFPPENANAYPSTRNPN